MYIALYASIMAVGAWFAWRRNPMYSGRTTLRYVLVIGLAVGAFVLAMIAVINLTMSAPTSVTLTAVFATTAVGTIAIIATILKLTTPKAAPLPPGYAVVNLHKAAIKPWLVRFGWCVVVLVPLALILPDPGNIIVGTFGGFFAFVGVVLLFTLYLAAVAADRSLSSVEAAPWVHWTYTPAEWQTWSDAEVARVPSTPQTISWRKSWPLAAIAIVVIIAIAIACNPSAWAFDLILYSGVFTLLGGLIVLANRSQRAAPQRLRRLLASSSPETYFGDAGLFAGGTYTQWLTVSNFLTAATIDDHTPRTITFVFEQAVVGSVGATSGSMPVRRNVLVPSDADADLIQLQTTLAQRYPKARIAIA